MEIIVKARNVGYSINEKPPENAKFAMKRCAGCKTVLRIPLKSEVDITNRFFCKKCYDERWGAEIY